ncbi:hypothetical protein AGMMS49592_0470 [Endomicrobiia bacterium]|nr:hypothetical protein AGMMS49592_0470 [Endomicrobiia bacterium]
MAKLGLRRKKGEVVSKIDLDLKKAKEECSKALDRLDTSFDRGKKQFNKEFPSKKIKDARNSLEKEKQNVLAKKKNEVLDKLINHSNFITRTLLDEVRVLKTLRARENSTSRVVKDLARGLILEMQRGNITDFVKNGVEYKIVADAERFSQKQDGKLMTFRLNIITDDFDEII